MIEVFAFTRTINGRRFAVSVSCEDEGDAKAFAERSGMTYEGSNVLTIPCVPVPQFMQFLESLTFEDRINWKPHAEEQIEAFISCGWPEKPDES